MKSPIWFDITALTLTLIIAVIAGTAA